MHGECLRGADWRASRGMRQARVRAFRRPGQAAEEAGVLVVEHGHLHWAPILTCTAWHAPASTGMRSCRSTGGALRWLWPCHWGVQFAGGIWKGGAWCCAAGPVHACCQPGHVRALGGSWRLLSTLWQMRSFASARQVAPAPLPPFLPIAATFGPYTLHAAPPPRSLPINFPATLLLSSLASMGREADAGPLKARWHLCHAAEVTCRCGPRTATPGTCAPGPRRRPARSGCGPPAYFGRARAPRPR